MGTEERTAPVDGSAEKRVEGGLFARLSFSVDPTQYNFPSLAVVNP